MANKLSQSFYYGCPIWDLPQSNYALRILLGVLQGCHSPVIKKKEMTIAGLDM